jgi:hypothetical protein
MVRATPCPNGAQDVARHGCAGRGAPMVRATPRPNGAQDATRHGGAGDGAIVGFRAGPLENAPRR